MSKAKAPKPTAYDLAKKQVTDNLQVGSDWANNTANIPQAQQVDAGRATETSDYLNRLNADSQRSGETTDSLNALRSATQRSGETSDVLNRYNDIAQNGYGAGVYQAEREQMQKGMNSQLNTQMSQLAKAQARGKVYGAAASAQQANALTANTNSKNDIEQQLLVKGADVKNQALGQYSSNLTNAQNQEQANRLSYNSAMTGAQDRERVGLNAYGNAMGNAQATELAKQQFNIGETDKATASKIGAATNIAGLVGTENYNTQQAQIGGAAVEAAGGKNPIKSSAGTSGTETSADRAKKKLAKDAAKKANKKK